MAQCFCAINDHCFAIFHSADHESASYGHRLETEEKNRHRKIWC